LSLESRPGRSTSPPCHSRCHSARKATAAIASDDLLSAVAKIYRANPRAPAKAVHEYVRDTFEASRATAGRYIAHARKRGILGKAVPRRAGEWGACDLTHAD
jgi:hypothetical protein